jgi:hypothetical protein
MLTHKYFLRVILTEQLLNKLPKSPKHEFSDLPQNDRSKRRSTHVDPTPEVGFEFGLLNLCRSRFFYKKHLRKSCGGREIRINEPKGLKSAFISRAVRTG